MVTLSTSATGSAPVALVWERYTKPGRWPSWCPQISRVDCADDVIRAGSRGVVHAVLGVRVPFEVTAVHDEIRTWSWTAQLPLGVRLQLRHIVRTAGNRTWTGIDVSGPLPIVIGYLPVARFALTRLVR